MMQTDKNLRAMISPEERMGVDHMLSVMATVAEVEVSNDLQVVKVYVSILGDERGEEERDKGVETHGTVRPTEDWTTDEPAVDAGDSVRVRRLV